MTRLNFSKIHSDILNQFEIIEKIKASDIELSEIPREAGIYVWYKKNKPLYVGKASGSGGLRTRISQHINPNYIEKRIKQKDKVFAANSLEKNGELFMEKSALRVGLCRTLNLCPGEEVLNYLFKNLSVAWITIPDIEMELIQEYSKKYKLLNNLGNKSKT